MKMVSQELGQLGKQEEATEQIEEPEDSAAVCSDMGEKTINK